jgi:acyl-CoA reductase-like NAD-dependent aldehyde dehydrogenase
MDFEAPILVFDDANLVNAVNGTAFASFVASGQTCVSGTRILVQEQIYEKFIQLFLQKVKSIRARMGDRGCIFLIFLFRSLTLSE